MQKSNDKRDATSANNKNAINAAQMTVGAVNEFARQGGQAILPGNTRGPMKAGETLVKCAAKVAPAAVAAVSARTVAAVAGAKILAVAAAPVALVGAAGYGVYRLVKWLGET